jgi:hypothetical protein
MSGFVWLASYPKSGNTWLRSLAASLAIAPGAALDINDLGGIGRSAAARFPFDALTLLDSALLAIVETDRLRPAVFRAMGEDIYRDPATLRRAPADGAALIKVHDAYRHTADGLPVFAGGRGAIVIVRDPRAVAASLASFLTCTIDHAIDLMASDSFSLRAAPRQFAQMVGSWSANVGGWIAQTDMPVHLVRYEDLTRDTAGVFQAAMLFAGTTLSQAQAKQAAAQADFAKLRAQEAMHGFREWSALKKSDDAHFFRRGEADGWRDELTAAQIARVEARHGDTMALLGYAAA